MEIKTGDVVRSLTEKLEGIVTGFVNATTVNVYSEEHGFEFPVLARDLVVIRRPATPSSPSSPPGEERDLTIDPGKFFQPRRLARENKPAPSSCSPLPRAVIEVDLHADTLLDTLAGMESRDVLEHQMEVFHRVMEEYASCRGQQIIFIHGKGNGVLRQNLYRELRVRYKRHHYNYAPFQKYGHGATIVTIR